MPQMCENCEYYYYQYYYYYYYVPNLPQVKL